MLLYSTSLSLPRLFARIQINTVLLPLDLPSLERLYLSHNEVQRSSDVSALSSLRNLADLAMDGNAGTHTAMGLDDRMASSFERVCREVLLRIVCRAGP